MQVLFISEYVYSTSHVSKSKRWGVLFPFSSQINLSIQVNRAAVQVIPGSLEFFSISYTEC